MNMLCTVLAEVPLAWLLFAVPAAAWAHHARPDHPLAGLLGVATEKLAARTGEGVGGFLNAILGNAGELIIALVSLRAGMMGLAAMAILISSVFASLGSGEMVNRSVAFSVVVSVILLAVYLLSLVFILGTYAHPFRGGEAAEGSEAHGTPWSLALAIGVMTVVTLLIVLMSEMLVATLEQASHALGLSFLFVGIVVVAVVGNAAEHSTAVMVALRNRMKMAVGIAVGSSTQIALFVTPLLVLLSLVIAPEPLSLAFSGIEVLLIMAATFVTSLLILDGKSTWFTSVQLIAMYLVMAIKVFAFLSRPAGARRWPRVGSAIRRRGT